MGVEMSDLQAFLTVARAGGFREGARISGGSASGLSDAVRRLETQLGVRLLNRTTRSVATTEAGQGLIDRLAPALAEMEAALDVVNGFRERPAGVLKLNVPVSAARLVLPSIVPRFLAAYPDIRLELMIEDSFVDVIAAGCDAGIRYDERLAQDMIAVPIGPRTQRFAAVASKDYLDRRGRPAHPRDLMQHSCIRNRFASGSMPDWEFERDGETVLIDPPAALIVQTGGGVDLAVDCAKAGAGIVTLFED
ncbi:HTH-type transcriptional regulator DmlR [compost metagenome]